MSPILWLGVFISIFGLGFLVRVIARVAQVGLAIFWLGLIVGGACGLGFAMKAERPQEARWQQIADDYKAAMQQGNEALAECTSKFTAATVLYEPSPIEIHLPSSVFGIPLPTVFTFTQGSVAHWVIPARIAPQLVSAHPGAFYFYIDKTGKQQGPFTPQIFSAAK